MDTTTQELKEMIERSNARREEWTKKGLERLAEAKPDLVIDPKKASLMSNFDLRYQIDEYNYLEVSTWGVYEGMTELGYAVEHAKKYDGGYYQLHETKYAVYMITGWGWIYSGATVQKFSKTTGKRYKGIRRSRAIHESQKGKYIELDGKRVYQTIATYPAPRS